MPTLVYNIAKKNLADGTKSLTTADDIRLKLVMSGTNAGDAGSEDFTNISSITSSCDSGGYSDKPLVSEVVTQNDSDDRAEFDADDVVFDNLTTAATADIVGAVLYWQTGTVPIAYIEFQSAVAKEATEITVPWDATGLLHVA